MWSSSGWATFIDAVRSAGDATDYRIDSSPKGRRLSANARRIRLDGAEGGTLIAIGDNGSGGEWDPASARPPGLVKPVDLSRLLLLTRG